MSSWSGHGQVMVRYASKINGVWGRSLKVFVCQKVKVPVPGGYIMVPGGYIMVPGGYIMVPGGYIMVPGGYVNKGVLLSCSGQLKRFQNPVC